MGGMSAEDRTQGYGRELVEVLREHEAELGGWGVTVDEKRPLRSTTRETARWALEQCGLGGTLEEQAAQLHRRTFVGGYQPSEKVCKDWIRDPGTMDADKAAAFVQSMKSASDLTEAMRLGGTLRGGRPKSGPDPDRRPWLKAFDRGAAWYSLRLLLKPVEASKTGLAREQRRDAEEAAIWALKQYLDADAMHTLYCVAESLALDGRHNTFAANSMLAAMAGRGKPPAILDPKELARRMAACRSLPEESAEAFDAYERLTSDIKAEHERVIRANW